MNSNELRSLLESNKNNYSYYCDSLRNSICTMYNNLYLLLSYITNSQELNRLSLKVGRFLDDRTEVVDRIKENIFEISNFLLSKIDKVGFEESLIEVRREYIENSLRNIVSNSEHVLDKTEVLISMVEVLELDIVITGEVNQIATQTGSYFRMCDLYLRRNNEIIMREYESIQNEISSEFYNVSIEQHNNTHSSYR